jgi:MFS family permease
MTTCREVLFGPWRAVLVLGLTQILTWGTLFYPPVLTLPLVAADHRWSVALAMGGFSLGLLAAGLLAPRVGAAVDRYGGHIVMSTGSLVGAFGLVGLVHATNPLVYLLMWIVLGAAMAASLYDSAFATLGRIFGTKARPPITALTLAGGFASTVSWPATHFLITSVGWRGTYLVYAALLALIAAPLHAFALPRSGPIVETPAMHSSAPYAPPLPAKGTVFALLTAAFAAYAFVPSALSAHMLAIFKRAGIDANAVVIIGMLFGPMQVTARVCEFVFARNVHPLWVARFAIGLLVAAFIILAAVGVSPPAAAVFAALFGISNGLITIARGTVPLALFGAVGYGHVVGRIAGPSLMMQAAAPLVLAVVAERLSDPAALSFVAALTVIALACFAAIRRPRAA